MAADVRDGGQRDRSVWTWVVRKAWLLALAVLLGVVAGVTLALTAPTMYESEWVVVASETTIPTDEFAGLATTVFSTETVLQPVIDELGLDATPAGLLSSGRLAVTEVRNAPAIRITALSDDPDLAVALARAAAESFISEAEIREMGTFQVFGSSGLEGNRAQRPITLWGVGGGILGGGMALVVLLLVSYVRRPLLTPEEALEVFPAEESLSARVQRRPRIRRGTVRTMHQSVVLPTGIGHAVWRALKVAPGTRVRICCVLVERGRRRGRWMNAVVDRVVETARALGYRGELVMFRWSSWESDHPQLTAALSDATALLVIVSTGTSLKLLHDLDQVVRSVGQPRSVLVVAQRVRRRSDLRRAGIERVQVLRPTPRPQAERSSPHGQSNPDF